MSIQECKDMGYFNDCTLQHCEFECHEIGLCMDLGHSLSCTTQNCRCECHEIDRRYNTPGISGQDDHEVWLARD